MSVPDSQDFDSYQGAEHLGEGGSSANWYSEEEKQQIQDKALEVAIGDEQLRLFEA